MLGQVWYLIVLISDLCLLAYFDINLHGIVHFSAGRLAVSAPPCMEIALGIIFEIALCLSDIDLLFMLPNFDIHLTLP